MNSITIKTQAQKQLDDFIRSYMECALWSSSDNETSLDAHYSFDDIPPETWEKAKTDCRKFLEGNGLLDFENLEDYNASDAGHDFWLTRNRHGAGFWDRTQLEADDLGDKLTQYIHDNFKEINLIVGGDGKLYLE